MYICFKKTAMQYFLKAIFIILFITACNSKNQNAAILTEDKMKELLMDLHTVDAAGRQSIIEYNGSAIVKNKQVLEVLKKHNLNIDEFNQNLKFYIEDIEKFDVFYDQIIEKFRDKEAELSKVKTQN
jgi:protein-tyrosine-phosphatase